MSKDSKSISLNKGLSGLSLAEGATVDNDTLMREGVKAMREGMSEDEFEAKFGAAMQEPVDKKRTLGRMSRPLSRVADTQVGGDRAKVADDDCKLGNIVLKVTTLSDANAEAPCFVVGSGGASIGRGPDNDISISMDTKLAPANHAFIDYADGSFFVRDGGFEHSASVRLVPNKRQWVLETDARFSAGSSVFRSCGTNSEGSLLVEIVGGPLRGERRFVSRKGVSIGRSGENTIALPDRELSRRHSKIVFDEASGKYYVCDVGSTNGTYMQLVGPFGMRYKLNLNDNILIGRTGFSVNRYDIGISEEIGVRPTMEDSTTIFQYLKVPGITHPKVTPLSYFAVYDGHGGKEASSYLSQHLHRNIEEALAAVAREIHAAAGQTSFDVLDKIVTRALHEAFLKTDYAFLHSTEHPEHGSTATTVLLLGQRLYCANVGDSRTVLCRNFNYIPLSQDHKPTRPDEAKRIKDAGGYIIGNRVMGELAVSRAFGDCNFKKSVKEIMKSDGDSARDLSLLDEEKNYEEAPLVIAHPEIEMCDIGANDKFLILACDGLFDVFTDEDDLVKFVKSSMEKYGDAQKCCQALSHEAIKKRGSKDNVSVILIILNRWY